MAEPRQYEREAAERGGDGGADPRPLQPASRGSGPLLERDYWALLDAPDLTPQAVASLVAQRFAELAPPALVRFHRRGGDGELRVGDELALKVVGAGEYGVRVVHRNAISITLATLEGHPEAGRITFGAYRHRSGGVIFHIRSRARSASRAGYLGFLLAGDPMQTNTWTDFVNRVAATAGRGVVGVVHVEKRTADEEPGDAAMDAPTFLAVAD